MSVGTLRFDMDLLFRIGYVLRAGADAPPIEHHVVR